ncbi:hypothetical protein BJX99DRAFT_258553 [Aspergillus californicus]
MGRTTTITRWDEEESTKFWAMRLEYQNTTWDEFHKQFAKKHFQGRSVEALKIKYMRMNREPKNPPVRRGRPRKNGTGMKRAPAQESGSPRAQTGKRPRVRDGSNEGDMVDGNGSSGCKPTERSDSDTSVGEDWGFDDDGTSTALA